MIGPDFALLGQSTAENGEPEDTLPAQELATEERLSKDTNSAPTASEPGTTAVPNVEGLDLEDAEEELKEDGFELEVRYIESSPEGAGKVLD